MADSTLPNLTAITLPLQPTDLFVVARGTARANNVSFSTLQSQIQATAAYSPGNAIFLWQNFH